MRLALLLTVTIACSTNGKREDIAPMPAPPSSSDASSAQRPANTPRVVIETPGGDVTVDVEIVATPAKIQKGLMFRRHLPVDGGMLFLMGDDRVHHFWMRNTLIPLDMIFIAKDMTIAGIVENAEPLTEELRTVGKRSLYVLEVNGGWSKKHGAAAGAKVRFENVPSS